MIRRLATAALLGAALLVPATVPVAPAATAATTPAHIQRGLDVAQRYAAAGGMRSGLAVLDLKTGEIWQAGAARQRFASASVVKTMIATRLLATGQMHGTVAKKAWSMITRSDNQAAWDLYPRVGRDHLLPWIENHYHLAGIGAPPTMHGIWGSTQITARGMVRFYDAVHRDSAVWPWLLKAMHAYKKVSATGEPNAFGLAAAAPRSAVKNGWDTNRDVRHPSNAIINTTGIALNDHWAVAILSEGPHSLYFRPGERVVTGEAVRVVRGITGGPIPPVPAPQRTVVLDPGHNGGNSTHLAQINRRVYAGYGRYKPCNTTGTATNAGYPEHAFTWRVANRVRSMLIAHHVHVIMTRNSDTGVGPCVNRRAAIESTRGVSAAIAIHADGAPSSDHGFHLCVDSRRPEGAGPKTVGRTRDLNADLHRALAASSGLSVANYVGRNGYYYRDDLAGLNLSKSPTAFLELGNMRNASDAAKQSSAAGRARIAAAITRGILAYLKSLS